MSKPSGGGVKLRLRDFVVFLPGIPILVDIIPFANVTVFCRNISCCHIGCVRNNVFTVIANRATTDSDVDVTATKSDSSLFVVVGVLLLTSQAYAEVPVLLLTFGSAALVQMGTNFLLGTISFVSDSVTVVLQLALSVDYAVIFLNRYKEEHRALDIREADIVALSKAIPEICSSSLTTVGGLIAGISAHWLFVLFSLI